MVPRPQKAGEHEGNLEKTQDTKMREIRRVVTEDCKSLGGVGRVDRKRMFPISISARITGQQMKPEIVNPKQTRGGGSSPSV